MTAVEIRDAHRAARPWCDWPVVHQVIRIRESLSTLIDYVERFADLNDEPGDGHCRETIAAAHALLADLGG